MCQEEYQDCECGCGAAETVEHKALYPGAAQAPRLPCSERSPHHACRVRALFGFVSDKEAKGGCVGFSADLSAVFKRERRPRCHSEAFQLINLKNFKLYEKILPLSIFEPNDEPKADEHPCEDEPRPPRHIGGLHDAHVVTRVMVCLVD